MSAVTKIQDILQAIKPDERNRAGNIYLNSIKNEFITFPGRIVIPRIPVKELPYDASVSIVENIRKYFPEFLIGHALLEQRRPATDLHSLQFVRPLQGRLLRFTHFWKIDLRFGGDSSNVVEKGDTVNYPSYNTNRIYYKSRLVPSTDAAPGELSPLKLIDALQVDSDMRRRTFAMFDELGSREMTKELLERLALDIFSTSKELYPFVVFDFFTACFSVVNPLPDEIETALELFEPMFIILHALYRDTGDLAPREKIESAFSGTLAFTDGRPSAAPEYIARLRDHFRRYKISRDDDLALKGWWQMEIAAL
jgi:hypothetical protein